MAIKTLKFIMLFISMTITTTLAAQTSYTHLGILCNIDVDITTPLGREVSYIIPAPSEGVFPNPEVYGPGSPHITAYSSDYIKLTFNGNLLALDLDSYAGNEAFLELYINKWVNAWGLPTNSNSGNRCCYLIRIVIHK